jgi:hypothetical protein
MSKLTKEEFRQEIHNFLQNINVNNTTINIDTNVDNELIDQFFYKYYDQVPKLDVYKDSITSMVQDAIDDGTTITFKDILEKWNESDDRTTIATNSTTDSIEDYLGGKKTKTNSNKRRTYKLNKKNKRKTNKRKTNKRKTNKRKNNLTKGGKRMTDTITTEPIAYKEDEYDQQKNELNFTV